MLSWLRSPGKARSDDIVLRSMREACRSCCGTCNTVGQQQHQPQGRAPRHDEQLADHARALADVLLHQLAARHADERAVGVVRHRARQQRLPRARRPIQQHALPGRYEYLAFHPA